VAEETRDWLTYLAERRRSLSAPERMFDVYLVATDYGCWLELEDGRGLEPLQVGLLDLANEHVPPGVLRVRSGRTGRFIFGLLFGQAEIARLRLVLAGRGHQGLSPGAPGLRARRSPLAA
jgi:hypothetical protein